MLLCRLQENAGVGKDRQSRFYTIQKPDSRCFSSACNCEKISRSLPPVCPLQEHTPYCCPEAQPHQQPCLPSSGCCLCSLHGSVLIKSFTRPCLQPTFLVVSWLSPWEASPRKTNWIVLNRCHSALSVLKGCSVSIFTSSTPHWFKGKPCDHTVSLVRRVVGGGRKTGQSAWFLAMLSHN